MQKLNISNKQFAMEYILYMMAGSYFKQAECETEFLERKLDLYYQELKDKEQIAMEEQCINYIEKELFEELPTDIWDQRMEVLLVKTDADGPTDIRLVGDRYMLRLRVKYKGKKTEFFYQLLRYNMAR